MSTAPQRLDPWTTALALIIVLTTARVVALFLSPLELYPDEAQYWLWSRTLDFGYYSKPPMVAWLIALTTGIGGDAEPWVRVSAPLLHAGAALALYGVGARLYGGWSGFWAAAIYSLMPGVQLSAAVIATDAPLLFFLSLALLAYATQLKGAARSGPAFALGAALGAAALSKYAAAYFLLGLILHAALSRDARSAWTLRRLGLFLTGFVLVLGPNLIWNATHGFETVSHTAANANWEQADRFNVGEWLSFLGAQFGVFGPLPMLLLLAAGVALAVRRRLTAEDRLLLCFILPPLVIISAQAFLSRANANWAVAAYAPGSVLVAAWLVRWRSRALPGLILASQGGVAALFLVAIAHPPVADALGLGNALKRARGWKATTAVVLNRLEPGLTAIAVDDRFLFNTMAYYGRDRLAQPGAPRLTAWVREATAQNQAEAAHPLTPAAGGRVLVASLVEDFRAEIARDFGRTSGARLDRIPLDAKRGREVQTFVAEGYAPAQRDPRTGLPISSRPTRP